MSPADSSIAKTENSDDRPFLKRVSIVFEQFSFELNCMPTCVTESLEGIDSVPNLAFVFVDLVLLNTTNLHLPVLKSYPQWFA